MKNLFLLFALTLSTGALANTTTMKCFHIKGTTLVKYGCADTHRDVVIPKGVKVIEKEAFSGCEITSVVIPNSVTLIGELAFAGNQLTSVVIPDSVTKIGKWAFAYNRLNSAVVANCQVAEKNAFDSGVKLQNRAGALCL